MSTGKIVVTPESVVGSTEKQVSNEIGVARSCTGTRHNYDASGISNLAIMNEAAINNPHNNKRRVVPETRTGSTDEDFRMEESAGGASDDNHQATDEVTNPHKLVDREYVSIHDDIYNLFFLCRIGGDAFWYSLYVFGLKMALYTFLAIDAFSNDDLVQPKSDKVILAAQFLMLPVAVAMQDDLIATYFLIANIKYGPCIRHDNPDAWEWKFHIATACRALDGAYSLCVNFVVLVAATNVLSLFLNFAALQFLQHIDNIALDLAADGFLTARLEYVAAKVKSAELPKRSDDNWMRMLDTVLFLCTVIILFVFWCVYVFYVQAE